MILSIDIGLYHLGLIGYEDNIVKLCELIDIKGLCEFCVIKDCTLHHDKCIADYMSHFFEFYRNELETASLILVEQQPPQGFVSIQELIRFKYRNKVKVISPRTVHAFFNINHMSYDRRKEFVVEYSRKALEEFETFNQCQRKHDLSDAYCILMYYLKTKKSSKYFMK